MGSMYRSEPMKLCQMILVKDATYECVGEVGKHSNVQFIDLNKDRAPHTKTFVRDVTRCNELERQLRFLELQVLDCVPSIPLQPLDSTDIEIPSHNEIIHLQTRLEGLERDLRDLNGNDSTLRKNLNESKEYQFVLQRVDNFFEVHMETEAIYNIDPNEEQFTLSIGHNNGRSPLRDIPMTPLLTEEGGENAWFVAGVIPLDRRSAFERILWRACRRTAFVRTSDVTLTIEDPVTLAPIVKCAFIVFFKGESLRQIVDKVCDGFNARQYACPKTSKERQDQLIQTVSRIHDLQIVIDSTQKHRYDILQGISLELPLWFKQVYVMKAIYHTLNMFTLDTNGFLAGECWIPENEMENVRHALEKGMSTSGCDVLPILNEMHSSTAPPTFHRKNKFTSVFQSIVDSYGIASYREVNPAPFTIITFPFLFALMFGDAAHGLILLLAGIFFVWKEEAITKKRIRDEIFNTFFGGRYIILLMGAFSIYTGFIYNDAFAKSANVFGSSWMVPNDTSFQQQVKNALSTNGLIMLPPESSYMEEKGPYWFGVDPVWNIAENRLTFLNSMKMKISVIIGVFHMTFGVFLSLLNHAFYKSYIDIFTNFIPQIIFLGSIFIYLCGQMIVKWIYFSVHPGFVLGLEYPGSNCAPSLLIGLINMFMFMMKERKEGYFDEKHNHTLSDCYLSYWYPNQKVTEIHLVGIAALCIPIMLFGKPICEFIKRKRRGARTSKNKRRSAAELELLETDLAVLEEATNGGASAAAVSAAVHHEHSLSDVVVHQAIHTIEFVLGCVSHTASYLRLWALSLAHAQLSEVLWHMVLMNGLSLVENPILAAVATFVVFFVFAVMTLSILVMMEGLSAFLHALRLHWVEFQSKFYSGDGHAFIPYSLAQVLEAAQMQSEYNEELANLTSR